jgi:carbon-monoxide dehydrogenase medium subunit
LKPAPFAYVAPRSLAEALSLLGRHGEEGKVLAGGQSLVPVLNFRLAQPAVLVDVNRVAELDHLAVAGGELRMGALTRHRRLEADPLVRTHAPLLAEAAPHIAHPQIRARGTVGGSLAHADPRAELPALAVALGARLRLQREGGDRWVGADEFYTGLFGTLLAADELVTEVAWPSPRAGEGSAFAEAARRHGDYAQVGVAAVLRLDARAALADARLVFLSVADRPFVAHGATAVLAGQSPGDELFAEAARRAAEEIEPGDDIHASAAFKRHLAERLTLRVLRQALGRARGEVGE